jgi:hypothetical protein
VSGREPTFEKFELKAANPSRPDVQMSQFEQNRAKGLSRLVRALSLLGLSHTSKAHASREIATAIRERFGLQSDTEDGGIVPQKKSG